MMDETPPKREIQVEDTSLGELLSLSPKALDFYFELSTRRIPVSQEQLLAEQQLSKGEIKDLLDQLMARGLIRRNTDKTFEAITPIETVVIILTTIRDTLRKLRQEIPQELNDGVPNLEKKAARQIEEVPYSIDELRSIIEKLIEDTLIDFQVTVKSLRGAPSFEAFIEELQTTLLNEVEGRMQEVRQRLDNFESIEAFASVLERLKNDVFDIVNISLSDMRERAFRLHELEEFRETLAELWNKTPTVIDEHLTTFEQDMKTLEASLGELFETKYRLGAFKGVIENFAREHIMTAVQNLNASFRLSLTEAFQDHIQYTQERFEKVSAEAQKAFEQLKNKLADWIKKALDMAFNELVNRNQEAADDLASKLEDLTFKFQKRFAEGLDDAINKVNLNAREIDNQLIQVAEDLPHLYEKEVTPRINHFVQMVEQQLRPLTYEFPKNFKQWRINYLENTEKKIDAVLQKAEIRVGLASQSLNHVWRRSQEVESSSFDLYRFVIGETDFRSHLASLIARTQQSVLIILPPKMPITSKILNSLAGNVRIRIVVADDPSSKEVKRILKEIDEMPNVQMRYDPTGDLWGGLKDFKEILLGNTTKGTTNVIGIASSHEDHIELLRTIMETRWLKAQVIPAKKA